MTGSTELLQLARRRAERLQDRYRAGGFWSSEPVDVVRQAAARNPSLLALADRHTELTYAALDERIDLACHAMAEAGVVASTPIVLVVGNDVDSVVAVHAALRLDSVVLLVPRSAGPTQVADILARTGAGYGAAPNWPAINEAELSGLCTWIGLGDAEPREVTRHQPLRAADAPAFVLYTSGTTSRPKGVIHSLSTLLKASANYIDAMGLGADDRIFLISPLASVTGVLQAVFVRPDAGRAGGARRSLGPGRNVRPARFRRRDVVRGSGPAAGQVARRSRRRGQSGPAARCLSGRNDAGPAHRRTDRGRVRDHRHPCLRVVRGAGEHIGPADRAQGRAPRRRRGGAGRRGRAGGFRRATRPNAASGGRTRFSDTPTRTTISWRSTANGSAPATLPR